MIRTAASRPFSVLAVTAIAALWAPAWTGGAHAQTSYGVLHTFAGPPNDGYTPSVGLGPIQAADGTLYGTTFLGGSLNRGTIFQVGPDGTAFTLLHSFTAGPMDGANPEGGLLQGPMVGIQVASSIVRLSSHKHPRRRRPARSSDPSDWAPFARTSPASGETPCE
jgi:uncharacterized repeat protein (TIGR03803 family)